MLSRRRFVAGSLALGLAPWLPALGRGGVRWERARVAAQSGCPLTVDPHCHVFSILDLPVDGFLLAVAHGMGLPRALDRQLSWLTGLLHDELMKIASARQDGSRAEEFRAQIQSLLRKTFMGALIKDKTVAHIEAIAHTLELITRPRQAIVEQLLADYPEVQLFLPAMVDYKYWVSRGRRVEPRGTTFELAQQIDLHAREFRRINLAGGQSLHGYVPFNPLRQLHFEKGSDIDSYAQIRRAIGIGQDGLGFVGIKIYPATGFMPTGNAKTGEYKGTQMGHDLDRILAEFFEFCQRHDIPIISHTSSGNGFGEDYAWRGSPWCWRDVLARCPKLRLDLAHFGHLEGVAEGAPVLRCLAWSKQIAFELMARYDHVYADLGYSPLVADAQYRKRYCAYVEAELVPLLAASKRSVVEDRLMYGTDWWLSQLEPSRSTYLPCFRETWRSFAGLSKSDSRGPTSLEGRFFGLNALCYLGVRRADGSVDKTNGTYRRLEKYYERLQRTPPEWLTGDSRSSAACPPPASGGCQPSG